MEPDFIFEISSEAGRKIGGIYTVLQSKAEYLVKKYGERYMLIGYFDERCDVDLEDEKPPEEYRKIFEELAHEGIKIRYARWPRGSNARLLLVDGRTFAEREVEYTSLNNVKKRDKQVNAAKFFLWHEFGVDSLMEMSWDFTDNVGWGWAVGRLLEKIVNLESMKGKKIIAHFHEWIAGAALLYAKRKKLPLATVFTTHATVLGRSLAAAEKYVVEEAREHNKRGEQINVSNAYRYKVEGKHLLETAAAKNADVFTTVSETVGDEVQYILGRKPDVITLNGLNFEKVRKQEEIRALQKYMRSELIQFCESYFIPYYEQEYKDCLLTFTAGRYEFLNKGFDIYINAMGKLNERLKKKKTRRRVFAFIFAPSAVIGPRISVIKNYLLLDKISEVINALPKKPAGEYTNLQTLVKQLKGEIALTVKGMMKGFIREGERPLINCFDLSYSNDIIISSCLKAGLNNAKDDVVKVIFYPTYLKANDGLMNMNYYDVISGMDVGVFPSRYEPFGYTPVEAGLKLSLAISSDTTGFGCFMQSQVKNLKNRGIRILHMSGRSADEAAEELADELEQIFSMNKKQLEEQKRDAYNLVKLCDWKKLINNYYAAWSLALRKKYK